MFMSMYPLHWAGSALETIIKIIFYLLVVIGQWRIFEKAGENGWKSLIPIYNVYILYKIIWDTRIFWIELALSLFLSIVPLIGIIGAIGIFFIDIAATAKLSLLSATAWLLYSALFFSGRYLLLFWALDHPNIMAVKKEESL